MVEVQFMTLDEITEFRERAARGAGYVYYRDETDYKFGSDEPIIPKYTRIDLTPAIIRMAQNDFINYGSLKYSADDINNGKKIILQQDMTEIERFDRIYRDKDWASKILNLAMAEALAPEMNPEGDIALQQLAFTKERNVLEENGSEIEKRINFHSIYHSLGHYYTDAYLTLKKDSPINVVGNPNIIKGYDQEVFNMIRADGHRKLKSDFRPLLRWNPRLSSYKTFMTSVIRNKIQNSFYKDADIKIRYNKNLDLYIAPAVTQRRNWSKSFKGITAVSNGKTPLASDLVLMSLDGSLDWRYVDTWIKSEMLSRYIVGKNINDIDPMEVSRIIGVKVRWKTLRRVLNLFSTWIHPPGTMYLYNLPPLEGGKEGTLYEDIRFQDQGVGRYRPITDETEANDFIEKYCTEISKGTAISEQIAKASEYIVEVPCKDNRGREIFLKHKPIAETLCIPISTYDYRLRVMKRNGFFKNYNYEFGKQS